MSDQIFAEESVVLFATQGPAFLSSVRDVVSFIELIVSGLVSSVQAAMPPQAKRLCNLCCALPRVMLLRKAHPLRSVEVSVCSQFAEEFDPLNPETCM